MPVPGPTNNNNSSSTGGGGEGHAPKTKRKTSRHVKGNSYLDHNTQLLEAIGQGKPRSVRRLLDAKADPNYQAGPKRLSPLMLACEIKQEETRQSIIELLLGKGAAINLQDVSGQTVLMKALLDGLTTASTFLRVGVNVCLEDMDGNTALNYAAEMGHVEHMHTILQLGRKNHLNVDHQNLHGLTPLLLAAREGHLEAAKVLVEAGASLSKRDLEHFMTAQDWMKLSGCYSDHDLQFLVPSSKKKDFYRQERMKRGIKTLADYFPITNEGTESPNVFTMRKSDRGQAQATSAFQFPSLSSSITAEPQARSMFETSLPKKHSSSVPPHSNNQQRRGSISFPAVSSVKTDLYKSSYLSRRKSILSDGYHTGALAPISQAIPSTRKTDPSSAKKTKLPPISK